MTGYSESLRLRSDGCRVSPRKDSGLSECGQMDSGSKDTGQGNAAYRNAAKRDDTSTRAIMSANQAM